MKGMEYMAFGVPFVAFDLSETRELAEGAAAYAEPGDVAGLASLIDDLLADPARRAAMGRTGGDWSRITSRGTARRRRTWGSTGGFLQPHARRPRGRRMTTPRRWRP